MLDLNWWNNSSRDLNNERLGDIIEEIPGVEPIWPVIVNSISIVCLFPHMSNSIPWDEWMRVLNSMSCPHNTLIWIDSQIVDYSGIYKVPDVLNLDGAVEPLRAEWSWVESCQIPSTWGNTDTWISRKEEIPVIDQLFTVNNPLSLGPVNVYPPSVGVSQSHTLESVLRWGFKLDNCNHIIVILNDPFGKSFLGIYWQWDLVKIDRIGDSLPLVLGD